MSYPKLSAVLLIISIIFGSGLVITNHSADAATPEQTTIVRLPVGQDTFKIELNETGLYELTYSQLQTAGMDVNNINPATLAMMNAGQTVAYEWVGDSDSMFEAGEKVRFFGTKYAGSRHDQQYVNNNVYWLWANGTPTRVSTVQNESGHNPAAYWTSTETFAEDRFFDFTDTNQNAGWAFVESDSWFWEFLIHNITTTMTVDLSHPVDVGIDANYQIEVFSERRLVGATHDITVAVNNDQPTLFRGTSAVEAMIHSGTTPPSILTDGTNDFHLRPASTQGGDHMFLNEITVEYTRLFRADNDQLLFDYTQNGGVAFAVDNLSVSTANDLVVWDVSNAATPVIVEIEDADISSGVGSVVNFGRTLNGASTFLVTTPANAQSATVSKYVATELNPANGAEWIAITHNEIRTEVDRLATHRAATNNIATHVVDVNDVINQHGFGYPIPDAIHAYLQQAYDSWSTQPQYVLLAGDASINPRQRPCSTAPRRSCPFPWNTTDVNYVPTYLVHQDPFVGLIPSDHPFSLMEGNDLIPELAVGRITVGNRDINPTFNVNLTLEQQAKIIVDKIIRYESAIENEESWTKRFIFLADDADAGGAFCFDSENAASRIPDEFTKKFFCHDDYIAANPVGSVSRLNSDLTNDINSNSAAIVNYRGHGSVVNWGNGILAREDQRNMFNFDRPFVVLSADCLDNYFSFNNLMSFSEAFMRAENKGAVAHWGSTGLGFSWEHTILHNAFYDGLYKMGLSTIGDAIVHSKTVYHASPGSRSELYAFTLQGDPAMNMPTVEYQVFVPIVTQPPADIPVVYPGTSEE